MKQYKTILSSLYWQQWSLRRKFRHTVISNEWHTYSLPHKILLYLEYPATLARDITIPTLEENTWNKLYAVAHPIVDPLFVTYILGEMNGFVGEMPIVLLCILIGVGPAFCIYLFTTNSRAPSNTLFGIIWALSAFFMCVMWVFTLAGELITCLSSIGDILSLPPAFLGLTILAWGNSIGDFFTNTAVAKQGLGAMAIAGCYAGPVFNLFMGLGTALVYATSQTYPAAYRVQLDASSKLSLFFVGVGLISTMAIVSYRDFKLDRIFGIYLLSLYGVYTLSQFLLLMLG